MSPWVNFEAGALSKSVDGSHVVPLLFDLKKSEVEYPLAQFQMRLAVEDDLRALVSDINAASEAPVDPQRLVDIFRVWWPRFEERKLEIRGEPIDDEASDTQRPHSNSILEEILDIVRAQQRMLASPDQIPEVYLGKFVEWFQRDGLDRPGLVDLVRNLRRMTDQLRQQPHPDPRVASQQAITSTEIIESLERVLANLRRFLDSSTLNELRNLRWSSETAEADAAARMSASQATDSTMSGD